MKMRILMAFVLMLVLLPCAYCTYADVVEEIVTTTSVEEEAVSAPATVETLEPSEPAVVETPAAPVAAETLISEPVVPAPVPSIPNPYTNMSDSEFYLLQQLAAEFKAVADKGLDEATAKEHTGRYGEDNYIGMLKSFAEAAGTLDTTLQTSPVDIRKIHITIKALKTLVLDIDDVFVYNAGYLNQLRNWNECKRILRRIDGLVYREGGLRRIESIWDSQKFFRDVGKFLNMHGVLSGVDDHLQRTNPTTPMDKLVGREGGKRRAAHVWTLPSGTSRGQLSNARSEFNEVVTQY